MPRFTPKHIACLAVLTFLLLGSSPASAAEDVKTLDIGAAAPDFKLPGVDGKTYALKDFASSKFLVVIFTCNHCPTAQAYEDRIMKLHADYKDKGVALVAISPNDPKAVRLDEMGYTDISDSLDEMKLRAKTRGFKFPYLYDGDTQVMSKAFGVIATPQVYIFDQDRKLRYVGRIDNSDVKEVTSHDARNAIDDLLAGRKVATETTKVFGCTTKWMVKQDDAQKAIEKWEAEPVELTVIDAAGIKELVKNDTKKLRLINVWATWCGPCVQELPELIDMNRMYRKRDFEFLTISMDQPDKKDRAIAELKKLHVAATNYLSSEEDQDKLVNAVDKDWQGPVPYTLLVAPGGKVIYRHTGAVVPLELKQAIVGYLGRTY